MKDKINKIKDDAYYQYGFYIGYAIANRILSESLPGKELDLKNNEDLQEIHDFCISSILSYNLLLIHRNTFSDYKNVQSSRQFDDIYKIFDLLQFEYLVGQSEDNTFKFHSLYNFWIGFGDGIDHPVREISGFYADIIESGKLSEKHRDEDFVKMMMLSFTQYIEIITRQMEAAEKALREDPALAQVGKFIHEKEEFLRQYKIDEETGFAKLNVNYECHIQKREYFKKIYSSKISNVYKKFCLLLRLLP